MEKQKHVKIIVVGDSGTGKTCLLQKLAGFISEETLKPTIGLECYPILKTIRGKKITAQFWDTAGGDRFRSLIPRYYADSHVILALFDITCRKSFDSIEFWLQEVRRYGSNDAFVFLIGNKQDLTVSRQVLAKENPRIQDFCFKKIEISAKNIKSTETLVNEIIKEAVKVDQKRNQRQKQEESWQKKEDSNGSGKTGFVLCCWNQ